MGQHAFQSQEIVRGALNSASSVVRTKPFPPRQISLPLRPFWLLQGCVHFPSALPTSASFTGGAQDEIYFVTGVFAFDTYTRLASCVDVTYRVCDIHTGRSIPRYVTSRDDAVLCAICRAHATSRRSSRTSTAPSACPRAAVPRWVSPSRSASRSNVEWERAPLKFLGLGRCSEQCSRGLGWHPVPGGERMVAL